MSANRLKYVAPNVVTCIGLSLGMFSVAESMQGHTVTAAWLVIVAVLVDKLDGTVARLLKATSSFGAEMDSFSDLITFGVAPAVFFLAAVVGADGLVTPDGSPWSDSPLGPGARDPLYRAIAFSCAFVYVIAAALRLAKFNLLGKHFGDTHFFGMTTTLSGALLASGYLTSAKYADVWYSAPGVMLYFIPVVHAGLALLMVSNIPLPKLRKRGHLAIDLFQYANVALVYLVGLTWFVLPEKWRMPEYLLGAALVYVFGGIGYAAAKGVKPPALPTLGASTDGPATGDEPPAPVASDDQP